MAWKTLSSSSMFFLLTVVEEWWSLLRTTLGRCHFSSLRSHFAECLVPELPLPINLHLSFSLSHFCLLASVSPSLSLLLSFASFPCRLLPPPVPSHPLIPLPRKAIRAKVTFHVSCQKTRFSINMFTHGTHRNAACDFRWGRGEEEGLD